MICSIVKLLVLLPGILATQAYAFADACLTTLCRREVDEVGVTETMISSIWNSMSRRQAMNGIDFSEEQRRILEA